MWSTSGFEADTLQELVNSTAEYYSEGHVYKGEEYLVIHTNIGETYVYGEGVRQFESAVWERIEELKEDALHTFKENYKCIGEGLYRERNVWGE